MMAPERMHNQGIAIWETMTTRIMLLQALEFLMVGLAMHSSGTDYGQRH